MEGKGLTGTLVLKSEITSSKFGVVFPEEVRMKCIQDHSGTILCEHPRTKNVWIGVPESKIKDLRWY